MTAERPSLVDRGFTLVEILIAIVLSGVIAGVTVAALATSMTVAESTSAQVADSTDAGLIQAFLVRDAQAAGATDPSTAAADAASGVSTDSKSGWAGCRQTGSMVVRFGWIDQSVSRRRLTVATYSLDAVQQLTRRICTEGSAPSDVVLGRNVASAVAACMPDPACGGTPTSVSVTVNGAGLRSPLAYTLTASMRAGSQRAPTSATASVVPLLAIGNPSSCPLTIRGTGLVSILGDAVVGGECTKPAITTTNGSFRPLSGIVDPFVGIVQPVPLPATGCAKGLKNPTRIGDSSGPLATVVYPEPVSISTVVTFAPGRYVFCNGLTIAAGATVSGTGVLLSVVGGTFSVNAEATFRVNAATTGDYANLLVWVASARPVTIGAGSRVSTYGGYLYAPLSPVTITVADQSATNAGGLIARTIEFVQPKKPIDATRLSTARVGLPIPDIGIGPVTLPNGQIGVATTTTTLTATSGTSPYTWWATGLPAGVVLSASGVLSGSPTASGSFGVSVTVRDASMAAQSSNYTITVNPQLLITGPGAVPRGQVGVAYPATTMTSSGGTAPITWAATGLPAGLTLAPTTGVISGTPTTAGDYSVAVTATDAIGAKATTTTALTVNAQLIIAVPAVPRGQVGVAYPATTVTTSGGTAPITWAATGLPAGLTLTPTTGVLSGSPTAAGTFTVTVTATDAIGAKATATATLIVNPVFAITTTSLAAGKVGVAYPATTLATSGGTVPITWSATGLPAGLTLSPTTGVISGTPTTAGTTAVAIRATDGVAAAATTTLNLVVAAGAGGCPTAPTGWLGEYFANISLAGAPTLCRDDAAIDFDWASGSPGTSIPTDNFSARWTRTQTFAADTYVFALGTDDGGRLYIDGILVLDRWNDQGYPTPPPTVARSLTAGSHVIVVEYYERGGDAKATLTWTSSVPSGCPTNPAGWRGEYYGNVALTGAPAICRDDAAINFNWAYGSPATNVPVDNFSVRWTRTQTFTAGTYTFLMGTDDGGRLYIDGVLVLDRWVDQSYPTPPPSVVRTLTAGPHDIRMEFYERGGAAQATLTWS